MGFKIKEIGRVITGNTPPKKYADSYGSYIPFLTPKDMDNKVSSETERLLSENGFNLLKTRLCSAPSISISCIGSDMGKACYNEVDLVTNQQINTVTDIEKSKFNPEYIYYLLSTMKEYFHSIAGGSTMPIINKTDFENIELSIPDISIQNKVGYFLSLFDAKIRINNSIISTLEQLAQTLFKRWFVDFEFPNENGEPYKTSGGEMVESELGMIPAEWTVDKFKGISLNFDKQRVPLSKLEREKRESIYPYYGAASLMDYVDDYLFEGVHILLGEDGSVVDKQGFPILQYVWGKFWVNNHAHVLKGKKPFTDEYIYLLLKQTNVENIITGAVQPKINQTNLNNIKVIIPNEKLIFSFSNMMSPLFFKLRLSHEENQSLINLRNTLLPKLLSGEIELPGETEVMDDVPISRG